MMNVKDIWLSSEYDKIRNNENIKNRVAFITLGGSHAYGTNIETSDIDVRGVSLNTVSSLIGLHPFEQVLCNETDTTIYSFHKIISLLINCNPNTIELLGGKEDSYYFPEGIPGELGKLLIANKNIFLSKKAVFSFGGYANQQLRRLENAISHDSYNEEQQKNHLKNTINTVVHHFNETYSSFDESNMNIEIKDGELVGNIDLKEYPVKDFTNILNELTNITRDYEKYNGRNRKKDDNHLNKHAMHLIRLYLMCLDILEKGEINTYRKHDREMLLEIRNGKYMLDDGTYRPEFFEIVNEYEKKLNYAKEHTELPDKPNMKKIEELVQFINLKTLQMR
jgi:predicted nucleotidyltransferase